MSGRRAGVNLPLFSARSSASWGIGELPDLVPLAAWLARAGMRELLLLPLGTIPDHETSPYAAESTVSIDPIYIALDAVEHFRRAGGEAALSDEGREALARARQSRRVLHDAVRRAKREALALAFDVFFAEEWGQLTPAASELAAYVSRERWWLDDYALFRALAASMPGLSWTAWPEPLRHRDPRALDEARRQLARDVLRQQYGQWVADVQWQQARQAVNAAGVRVIGDLPFVANGESPEIWARAGEFLPGVSAGVPPDAFSEVGQDWGLPTYNWAVIAAGGYHWMRQRARRMAVLYDGLRVDHVVGLYRTYGRPHTGEPFFNPPDEARQLAQGTAILTILRDTGLDVLAEDLGVVPDFVRRSLADLGVPGCKVLRWERAWKVPGEPYLPPAEYPHVSAALTGTHDTEPLAAWWDAASREDRAALVALPLFEERGAADPDAAWSERMRDVCLELVYRAGSDQVIVPIQDLFGWPDRVNVPGTVGRHNWTWSLPWPVDELAGRPDTGERAGVLHALAASTGRLAGSDYTRGLPRGVHTE